MQLNIKQCPITSTIKLFTWSVLGIFSQLAFVRMFTTLAGGTSYYSNLFLLIGIVSLGSGFFVKKLSKYFLIVPFGILLSYFCTIWIGEHNLISSVFGEFLWSSIANIYPKPTNFDLQMAILILSITITPVMMVIGSQQAINLLKFSEGFVGYLVMGFGGVFGAVIFSVQNQYFSEFLWLIIIWSILSTIPMLLNARQLLSKVYCIAPLIILISYGSVTSVEHLWSPYQRIDLVKSADSTKIYLLSNGFYISSISVEPIEKIPLERRVLQSAVFSSVEPEDNVLILGSCAGTNDVREALFANAKNVTAVEIDPSFIELGNALDPNETYKDNRVQAIIADARQFLNNDPNVYDIIYLAFLDSQTNASNKSRFRLDSFLYTQEGIQLIQSHLKDDGILFINFATATQWIKNRMFLMLKQTFGNNIQVFQRQNRVQTLYVITSSHNVDFLKNYYEEQTTLFENIPSSRIPTDDWPFFYSLKNQIPMEHLRLLIVMLILMLATISIAQNIEGGAYYENNNSSHLPQFSKARFVSYAFFSGAAFFFIELRAISALVPILGSSYLAQAFVVIGIIFSSLFGSLLPYYFIQD